MSTDPKQTYETLAEWAEDRADMSIVCTCGRTINLPAAQILTRFRFDGSVMEAATKVVCKGCQRRGQATLTPVPRVRR